VEIVFTKIKLLDSLAREVLFEGDSTMTTVQKVNTENRTERTKSKSAASF
jgi:hypothetical protein